MSNDEFTSINEDIFSLSSIYGVAITDANGCIKNETFTVSDPDCNVTITPIVTSPNAQE